MSSEPATTTTTEPAASREVVAIARGAGFLAMGKVFSGGIRIVMAIALANWLGADDYGLYILAVSTAFAASGLASLGLDTAMERNVAVHSKRGDAPALRGSLQVGLGGTIVTSVVVGAALLIFADSIATGVFDEPDLVPLLGFSAALTPLLAVNTLLLATLIGFKRMGEGTLAGDFIQPVLRLALLGALAVGGMTASRAGLAITASYVASTAAMAWMAARLVGRWRDDEPPRRSYREIMAFAFPFWFAGLLRIVRTRLQPLLLGALGTVANVGVFSVVTSASTLGRIANLSINKALRPTLAQLHDVGDRREIGRLYATTTRWTLSVNLPVFLVMVLLPDSLLALFGPNFNTGVSALVVVAVAELVNAATGMCGAIIAMSGHNRLKLINSFVWMAVSVIANVALIPPYGVMGAAVAILIATITINLLRTVELWVLMRIQPWDRRSWKPIAAAAITALAALATLQALPTELGVVLLAVVSVGIAGVYVALLRLFGFEDDDQLIIDRLGARLPRIGRST